MVRNPFEEKKLKIVCHPIDEVGNKSKVRSPLSLRLAANSAVSLHPPLPSSQKLNNILLSLTCKNMWVLETAFPEESILGEKVDDILGQSDDDTLRGGVAGIILCRTPQYTKCILTLHISLHPLLKQAHKASSTALKGTRAKFASLFLPLLSRPCLRSTRFNCSKPFGKK